MQEHYKRRIKSFREFIGYNENESQNNEFTKGTVAISRRKGREGNPFRINIFN